jgi:hypothetical protein
MKEKRLPPISIEVERYALEYERKRLDGHALVDSIVLLGEEFNGLGYDIKSFENIDSLIHDRFIEVKSFANPYFYWSLHEQSVAAELGHQYYLYLIDYKKMPNEHYSPIIIKDPISYFRTSANWLIEDRCFLQIGNLDDI